MRTVLHVILSDCPDVVPRERFVRGVVDVVPLFRGEFGFSEVGEGFSRFRSGYFRYGSWPDEASWTGERAASFVSKSRFICRGNVAVVV